MSDLCVLTASLLVQGKAPGWKLATPPEHLWASFSNQQSQVDQVCKSKASPSITAPTLALHRPEFSRRTQEVSTQPFPKPASGNQLYAQRIAALQAGHLYTRLPANSFQSDWQHATYHPTYEDWVKLLSHEAKAVARGQGSQKMTVLLGDSLAQWFPAEQLSRERFWLNQGVSGETTGGVLKRLALLDQTNPDSVYVMVGINDLRQGSSNRDVLNNLRQIIQRLRAAHPQTKIYIASVLPTRLTDISSSRIRRLNYNIAALTQQEQAHFINLQPAFSDEEGNLQTRLTTDGLHLNANGYKLWQLAMSPIF